MLAQAVRTLSPSVVLATGTDRGNEVVAQAAARLDLPFSANCIEFGAGEPFEMTRVRWGGSLLEDATLDADVKLADRRPPCRRRRAGSGAGRRRSQRRWRSRSTLGARRSVVKGRVEREAGVTLATAPVVVGGGRGVGSPEGFAPLQELAAELGGVVGCSRAVTNNGWRNHTDQVGQTGTRIAPDVYFACGISGAIQHWVGAMASKNIIAINTDQRSQHGDQGRATP